MPVKYALLDHIAPTEWNVQYVRLDTIARMERTKSNAPWVHLTLVLDIRQTALVINAQLGLIALPEQNHA